MVGTGSSLCQIKDFRGISRIEPWTPVLTVLDLLFTRGTRIIRPVKWPAKDRTTGNVPSKLRACAAAQSCRISHTNLSLPRTFIGLVYSQFELINIKLKSKVKFLLFMGTHKYNVCYGAFSKIAAPRIPEPSELLHRRRQLNGNVDCRSSVSRYREI